MNYNTEYNPAVSNKKVDGRTPDWILQGKAAAYVSSYNITFADLLDRFGAKHFAELAFFGILTVGELLEFPVTESKSALITLAKRNWGGDVMEFARVNWREVLDEYQVE